jgi:hypothetical protein
MALKQEKRVIVGRAVAALCLEPTSRIEPPVRERRASPIVEPCNGPVLFWPDSLRCFFGSL